MAEKRVLEKTAYITPFSVVSPERIDQIGSDRARPGRRPRKNKKERIEVFRSDYRGMEEKNFFYVNA